MAVPTGEALARELSDLCGPGAVVELGDTRDYLHDATEHQGPRGEAGAVVLPATEDELAAVMGGGATSMTSRRSRAAGAPASRAAPCRSAARS